MNTNSSERRREHWALCPGLFSFTGDCIFALRILLMQSTLFFKKIQRFCHSCFPDVAPGVIKRKTICNVIKYHRNVFYMLCSISNDFCWLLGIAIKHFYREEWLFWIYLVQLYVHPLSPEKAVLMFTELATSQVKCDDKWFQRRPSDEGKIKQEK